MKKIYLSGLALLLVLFALTLSSCNSKGPGAEQSAKQESAAPQGGTDKGPDGTAEPEGVKPPDETQAVEIEPGRQKVIALKTVAAAVKPLRKSVRTVGRVEYDERRLTSVNLKVDGWIDKLYADYTGKYVKQGTPLAEIYSPELMSVQLEFINLLDWLANPLTRSRPQRTIEFTWGDKYGTVGQLTTYDTEGLVRVAKQKLSLWDISDKEITELEEKKVPKRTMTIRSPASGYVLQKPAFKGNRVAVGEKIFDIVDLSTVWVIADIYEYEIPYVRVGQNAKITLSAYPDKEFRAKVDFIYPSLSGQTRTGRARFVLPNPGMVLKPQMFANVEMEIDMGERLAVPETAILDTGTRQVVYVDQGDGYFSPRQVTVGIRANGMAEILKGVKAGEKVASSAVFLIDSEAKLKGVKGSE